MTREEIVQELYRGNSNAIKEAIKVLEQEPCEDAVSRKAVEEMLNARGQKAVMTFDHFIELLYKLPSVTPTKPKCEKLADNINPAEYSFTHYARLTPEEAEHDLFRLDRETGEYIPLTDNTHYPLPETSEQFKDIKQAVIKGCANMMKAVGEKL